MPGLLLAAAALAAGALTAALAQTPLQPQLAPRPLTPTEIVTYGLPAGTEQSGGLLNVGLGQPVYLEADVNLAIPAADIQSVTWSLNSAPVGSKATLANSPLGSNVPVYEPSDRLIYQVAGRMLFRPDLAGTYTMTASIVTASEGSTNLTLTVTAATYMGINTCALCHSGGQVAENTVVPWEGTLHSVMFANGINGLNGSHYSAGCIQCHTVGYDTNTNTINDGGFNWVAAGLGWTFPTVLTNGNWLAMQTQYPSLANLANIQCENCHGPGSQHATLLGATN